MCYIRKELMRPYLSISDVIIGDFWTTWKRRYLHAYGRVYLGRVTLFADDGSLELQLESHGCLAKQLYYTKCREFRWILRVRSNC